MAKSSGTFIQRSRSKAPSEKAAYHQIVGAGTSHVKREFFGLSASDEEAIVDRVTVHLERAVKAQH